MVPYLQEVLIRNPQDTPTDLPVGAIGLLVQAMDPLLPHTVLQHLHMVLLKDPNMGLSQDLLGQDQYMDPIQDPQGKLLPCQI